jgi:ketosteroid isomerase-like protein
MSDDVELVRAYIEAARRARNSQSPEHLAAMRRFLADDVSVKMASGWTDTPWRVVFTAADQLVERMKAPINRGASLTTENANVVQAGKDVLVEQLSTITRDGRKHVTMICHIFTVEEGKIVAVRAYRNDDGLPPG